MAPAQVKAREMQVLRLEIYVITKERNWINMEMSTLAYILDLR